MNDPELARRRRPSSRGRAWQLRRRSRRASFPPRVSRRSRERSLEVPLAVAGIVVLAAFVVRLVLAHRIVTPWIMIDELLYSELAKNFADSGEFLVRDAASPFNNLAYPALISPAWLAEPVETAYALARRDQRPR